MKKSFLSIFVIALLLQATVSFAQAGAVYTVAGGGTSLANGVPATTAGLSNTTGVAVDAFGNVYFTDNGHNIIRKVDGSTGLIYTVAGNGIAGYSGDGGLATNAQIGSNRAIFVDGLGNIYIADHSYSVVRKVDASTGIINTIAGRGSSLADGIPATNANIGEQLSICVDRFGDIYCSGSNRVRKIFASTGIITTVAGGGTSTADGIHATAATIPSGVKSISVDSIGSIYIISHSGSPLRKVDGTTGIITTIAGAGSSSANGIPATASSLSDAHSCKVDALGNVFIADWSGARIRRIDATTGIITTIAGGGTLSSEGLPATASRVYPYQVFIDPVGGNVFYSDFRTKIRKFSFAPIYGSGGGGGATWGAGGYGSDSFGVSIHKECSGPQLTLRVPHYHSGLTISTYYGDGVTDTASVARAYSGMGGYALTRHVYPATDSYLVRHILYNGTTAIDSFHYTYHHVYCSMLPVRFYNDGNANCVKDALEVFITSSTLTEVDSNGVHVDTIAATSGFNYNAFGHPGDVYRFRILSLPDALTAVCPSTGIITDTLLSATHTAAPIWLGLGCSSSSSFDLAARAYVPVTGPRDQWGHIYLSNSACAPTDGRVTLQFSPKYIYTSGARPAPVSSTPHSITWDVAAISGTDATPRDLYYVVWHNPATGYLRDGDTVNEHITITPISGDSDPSNNIVIRQDTVRASCDPNAIEVSPANCYDTDGELLHFTVHFENMGSAPAENIYVMDTMSDNLDISSLKIISSSHLMFVSKYQADGRTIMKFDFPNIMLADSSRHGERDGMFMYDIRAKTGLDTGTNIMSRVGIYFDYNDVVMTNEVHNVKGCPVVPVAVNTTATSEGRVRLYPNPAGDVLNVTIEAGSYSSLTICNAMGQLLITQGLNTATTTVDIKALPTGVYYVTLQGTDGTVVRKVVKW